MRKTALEKDWTKGSIIGNLWSLSWPMMIGQSLNMVGPTIDMIWVGKLGTAAIAGVGVAGIAVMMLDSMTMSLGMGARALIARFMGAGDINGANHAARQSFVICSAFSIIMVLAGILLAEPLLRLLGMEADVVSEGAVYMRITLLGSAIASFRMISEGIMQSSGDSVTPMWVSIFTRVIHVVLCPFLVFGWWLFPALGVSGAAWTNVLSQGLGTAIGLWVLFSGRTRIRLTLSNFRIDLNMIWRIVRIAIPVSFMGMQRSLGQLVLMWFISPFGTIAVAAHSLCQRVEMFIMMPGMGLGQGGGVLAGQNLGAGQPERAERSVWLAISVLECFVVFSSVALLLWAENIVIIFSPEPEVIEVSGIFLRIAAAGYFLFSIEPILSLSLSNVGDTIPPLLTTVLSFWLLQIPLAHFLPQVANLGVYGIRWGMMIGMVIPAIALAVYFKLGRWKYKNV